MGLLAVAVLIFQTWLCRRRWVWVLAPHFCSRLGSLVRVTCLLFFFSSVMSWTFLGLPCTVHSLCLQWGQLGDLRLSPCSILEVRVQTWRKAPRSQVTHSRQGWDLNLCFWDSQPMSIFNVSNQKGALWSPGQSQTQCLMLPGALLGQPRGTSAGSQFGNAHVQS